MGRVGDHGILDSSGNSPGGERKGGHCDREQLRGAQVLVPGAANGIGQAAVELFLAEGATVAAVDRGREALAEIDGNNGQLLTIAGDIVSPDPSDHDFAQAAYAFGGINIAFSTQA